MALMENRTSKEVSRRSSTGKPVVRNKDYYLNNLDIEKALHEKAVSIAERIFTAFVRENNIQVSLNTDDLADQIINKLVDKLPRYNYSAGSQNTTESGSKSTFEFDDTPVIIKTDKVEIKGELAKAKKSDDSISKNLDALEDFSL